MTKKPFSFLFLSLLLLASGSAFAAKIINVTSPNTDGIYNELTDTITVNVIYDEPIEITGKPFLFLNTRGNFPYAQFVGVNNTVATFIYRIQPTDRVRDLNYNSSESILLLGGSVKDLNGVDANPEFPAFTSPNSLGNNKEISLLGPAPHITITGPNPLRTTNSFHTVRGTAAFGGSLIRVFVNRRLVASVPGGQEPNRLWSFSLERQLLEPVNNVTVQEIESRDGLYSRHSNVMTYIVDNTPPDAPKITSPQDPSTIADNTPTITGTTEPGAKVEVFVGGTKVGETTADANGDWSFTLTTPLADGDHAITAKATDDLGNVGPLSDVTNVTIDSQAPVAPAITNPTGTFSTPDPSPLLVGTAEPGTNIEVTIRNQTFGPTPVDANGNWSLTISPDLPEGIHPTRAFAIDSAGNRSDPSNLVILLVDLTAPLAPVITTPADDSSTNNNRPVISGTAPIEAETRVEIFVDGNKIGEVPVDANGNWTFTPTAPLADGDRDITATVKDQAGNVSPVSAITDVTIDTVAPAAPVITAPADDSRVTDTTPDITGTAEPGTTVEIFVDGTKIGETTADPTGNWTFTPTVPLADGDRDITTKATDPAGNTSPESPVTDVTIVSDATPPNAPVINTPADNSATSDNTPTIAGTAEPNSTVEIFMDGIKVGDVPADANGDWSFTPSVPFADGDRDITATAKDAAGNISQPSTTTDVLIDTVAPAAPVISAPADGGTVNDTTPDISGTAEPGTTIEIFVDGTKIGETTADPNGNWSFVPSTPLAEGDRDITAKATDPAGNTSPESPVTDVTVVSDTTPPNAPVINVPADNSATSDNTPTISGTAEPGSTVEVFADGIKIGETTADPNGDWSFVPATPLADGDRDITATAKDAAGNTSQPSATTDVVVDTVAPSAPLITGPVDDSLIMDTTPTISGTAEPGTKVEIFVDGTKIGETTADPNGDWSFTPTTPLAEGDRDITAKATDDAGNTSPDSTVTDVNIDSGPPPAPVITAPTNNDFTNDTTPTFSGTAEPGSTVEVFVDGTKVGETTADPSGNWTFTPTTALPEGARNVTAKATDSNNNTGPESSPITFTVDTTAPAAPVINVPTDNTTVADNTPEISGTAEPNSTVEVFVDGIKIGETTADPNGNFTFTPTAPLADGNRDITAVAVDPAGNKSPASAVTDISVDTVLPSAPTISTPADGTISQNNTPSISGRSDPNNLIEIFVDGASAGTTQADGFGNWTLVPGTPLTEGPHEIKATATDPAQNKSLDSNVVNYTVDTTAPPAPVIVTPADGSTTEDQTPTISGTGEPNTTVLVTIDALTVLGEVLVDGNGNWSFEPTTDLPLGSVTFVAIPRDGAGNIGSPSNQATVDIVAPAPGNQIPVVDAGPNQTINFPDIASLSASASDDATPNNALLLNWSLKDGPGTVTFSNPNALDTKARFSGPGTYVLALTVNDGQLEAEGTVTVVVNPAAAIFQVPDFVNTFNPKQNQLTIPFTLARAGQVSIQVYDHFGDEIKTLVEGSFGIGTHAATWNGSNQVSRLAGSGVYLIVFKMDGQLLGVRKVISAR